mgnify:CR=1 FL=1
MLGAAAAVLFEVRHWDQLVQGSIGMGPLLAAGFSSFAFGVLTIGGEERERGFHRDECDGIDERDEIGAAHRAILEELDDVAAGRGLSEPTR